MASGTFSNLRAGLPAPAECFGIGIGLMELVMFGLAGVANPLEFSKGFGVPMLPTNKITAQSGEAPSYASSDEKSREDKLQKTQEAYITAIAARNIQNGVLLLTLGCYVRDRRALGIAIFSGVITTVGDAWIVRQSGDTNYVFGHLIGVMNSLLIGGSLLYWGRNDKLW